MDHQSFRFYIPGIVFLFPIYSVICWITVNYYTNLDDSDFRTFVLLGGITTFPVIALPIGWWIFNAYRVWWLILSKGGYENKDFVKLIRKDTKPFYFPSTESIFIDFSHLGQNQGWIKIDTDIFRKTFCPFISKEKFQREIERIGVFPKFTEPLSDYILFKDKGYDYARSISSVRYGLESSVFALTLSLIYASGLRTIWLFKLHHLSNEIAYIAWLCILTSVTLTLIVTLIIRWRYADREYDARLNLTTLTTIKSNFSDVKVFKNNIPQEIVSDIDNLNLMDRPYAAFDLDNTLLVGDIGEAVFVALIEKGLIKNFNWKDYKNLLSKDREAAYKKVVEVMKGIPISTLEQITHSILDSEEKTIQIHSDEIPVPKANPIMQSIIGLLKTKGVDVYVVTASNKVSAEIACWKSFGIPHSNVLGAIVSSDWRKRIVFDSTNIPFGERKVTALKEILKTKPIVTGGDGVWDKSLLDYTTPDGIRLWLGQDRKEYQKIKDKSYKELKFHFVERKKN